MSTRFFITTLGCKVNQYESHALLEAWQEQGWHAVAEPVQAEFILVNTCAVTARAVADARAAVRRLHREAPSAAIWLTGCAAEAAAPELESMDGVKKVLGQSRKTELLHLPQEFSAHMTTHATTRPGLEAVKSAETVRTPFPDFRISGYDRSRPVLKVQDGCSHRCTYCIVPLTRGPARSRLPGESLAEARRLLAAGFREITLSGINLRQYRHVRSSEQSDLRHMKQTSTPETAHAGGFWDLVEYLEHELAPEWSGRARLRISSLEPGQLDARALAILSESRLIAPQLHLSLQSGSPSVLARMGRGHYDPATIVDFLRDLRKARPLLGLGADILTGFPGESEAEFQETLNLCRALPFSYAHVFPYSRRPGTLAADMSDQIAQDMKKQRAALLRQAVQEKKQAFLQELLRLPLLHVVFEDRPDRQDHEELGKMLASPIQTATPETLGSRHRAAPGRGALRGVCEFYADCLLERDPAGITPREITPVRPLRLSRGVLVVEKVDQP